jgi:hypothetical protein
MARALSHKDVEFHTGDIVSTVWEEAVSQAVFDALSQGKDVELDVVIWSEAGARWYGGDDAVEDYKEDPGASVFDRIVIKASSRGRIP